MKLKLALLCAAAGVLAAPAAMAQDTYQGLYGAIGAGYNTADGGDENYISGDKFGGFANTGTAEYNYDNGVAIYSALGYAYGTGLRTELEFSYRTHDYDTLKGFTAGGLSGDMDVKALLANVIYDIPMSVSRLQPYVGVGVGAAVTQIQFTGSGPAGALSVNQGDTGWAAQGIAGVGYKLTDNLTFDLSYRYFITQDAKIEIGTKGGFEADYDAHTFLAGLRWNFGAAPAAPEPAPQYKTCWDGSQVLVADSCPPQIQEQAPAVPDDLAFTVYFDFNKSTLTNEAQTLIAQAARQALSNDIQNVVVEGNADRSGSSAYNQVLSQRRAQIVRDGLIANGVPAERITMRAFGEDNPAKPTEDGIREPLNRRTDVTIKFE